MGGIKITLSGIGANIATAAARVKRAAVKSLLVIAVASTATNSSAYEIPTTPSGSWTASGVTTGTIPGSPAASPAETGSYFKTTPSGLRMTVTTDGVFPNGSSGAYFSSPANASTTGLNPSAAGTNPGVFTTTPVLPTSTNPINMLVSSDQCRLTATALTTCTGLGTIKIQLTDPVGGLVPVLAPKIHVTRLGGTIGAMELASGLQINAAGSTTGIGFAATAAMTATLNVTGGNEFFGNPNAVGTNLNVNCGATATSSAGCGTVQVTGNPATILMNVKSYRTAVAPNIWDNGGDAFFLDMSFDEDFGGAPNTYEGGGVAAGHLITDLRLGAGVTAENLTTANGGADATGILTVSPLAVAAGAAPGDTNDGVSTFPALTTDLIGGTYTVTPTFSGASRGGKICGWIDFNQDGLYTASEGICNTFAAAATSAPLTWTLPAAIAAGQTYARVRITYDTNMTTASFNGLFSSGEVEDYQLDIMPMVKIVKALAPVADTGTFNLTINGTTFASAIGNGGTTNFRSVYHAGTPDVTVATNVKNAAITGVVLTETGAGATVLGNYVTTSACVNAAGTAVTVAGTAAAPSITIPRTIIGASANGRAQTITCTLTNTRKPSVTLTKISYGGVRGFTFTGTNGWTSQTITTVTSGAGVAGASQALLSPATSTTITETAVTGYTVTAITCTGLGAGGYTPNLVAGSVVLDAAATAGGNNIACTFSNTASIDAINDDFSATSINATSGGATASVFGNDTLGATSFPSTAVTPTLINDGGLTGAVLNADGTITVPAGTTVGSYTLTYKICSVDSPTTCDTATAIVVASVSPPITSAACSGTNLANNGGFELPNFTGAAAAHLVTTGVPGWTTTDTAIEIWDSGFLGVPSYSGDQHAELNAYTAGTLTQTGTVHQRSELLVYWAHRGRNGTDTASVTLSDNTGASTSSGNFSTGNTAWVRRSATLVTGPTASTFSMAFTAVTSAGGNLSVGNFLDGVEACQTYVTLGKAVGTKTDVDTSSTDTAGDTIAYQYTISNPAGNARAANPLTITDNKIGTINVVAPPLSGDTNTNGFLDPGESWVVQANYTLTQADIDAGTIANTAYVTATTGTSTIRSDDVSVTATLTKVPNLTIVKTADKSGPLVAGEAVTFYYLVTNTGNVTMSGVGVTETAFNGTGGVGAIVPAGGATTLAPGANTTFTATYTVTQTDIDQLN